MLCFQSLGRLLERCVEWSKLSNYRLMVQDEGREGQEVEAGCDFGVAGTFSLGQPLRWFQNAIH
jgi:hypothetical protein